MARSVMANGLMRQLSNQAGRIRMQVISATQARRRFRRIMKLLQEGHSFVITKNGKPACKLVPPEVP
ncbi:MULTISPECIES: type II toxin-antitoxin system Phd/YefM family antitoxin [Pseudomonas]|uniref:type II toxin-antitoxin system Phd/YefM family antitoxin n=1 Tax=Pseudomonas TaxID=286 RepID=UPI002E1EDDAE